MKKLDVIADSEKRTIIVIIDTEKEDYCSDSVVTVAVIVTSRRDYWSDSEDYCRDSVSEDYCNHNVVIVTVIITSREDYCNYCHR
jgi:hypothetical protein